MPEGAEQRDFFISFNSADLAHAEAIDAALKAAGFSTFYHPTDLLVGGRIAQWMDQALMNARQMLALYSPDYVSSGAVYSEAERYAQFWQDPKGEKRKIIPVVLKAAQFTPLFAGIKRIDVEGKAPKEAAAAVVAELRSAVEKERRNFWRGGLPQPKIFNVAYRPNPNFTGRFDALESLQHSVRTGSNAAITAVAGMGGIGKTTLAAEYCHRFGGRYAGVWWVRAEQEPVMLADLAALGERLGIAPSGNVETDARAVLDHLGSVIEPWLMVYDNAPNPDAVRKWLPVGAVRAIITSRFTEFEDLAPVIRVDQWADDVTAEYLLARTGRDDAEDAARLAKLLSGLPLAAEQAATFLRTRKGISFDAYASDIARLIKRKRDAGITGDYPDTVYAAFVKSLETLQGMQSGEIALHLLRLCAFLSPDDVDIALVTVDWGHKVFPANFAAAMSDQFAREDALAALTSLSLLRQEDGPVGPVLIFHRLLLEVVRDWMGEDARALWGSAAVRLVNGAFPGTQESNASNDPSTWPLCLRLMPHVAPLQAHAPLSGDAGRTLGLLLSRTGLYLSARGDRTGALAMAEKSLVLARKTRADEPLELAIGLGNFAGRLADLDRLDEAEAAYREALQIVEGLLKPDDPSLAIILSNLAEVHWKRRAFDKAEPLYLRAADVMKTAHGPESAEHGKTLSNLGALYGQWADEPGQEVRREQEADYKTRALAITRKACGERHPSTATRYHNFAVMKMKAGDWSGAAGDAERAVAIMLSLDLAQHPDTQGSVGGLAQCWEQSGQADKAARLQAGAISDLVPVIAQIEREHRAWVAEDPENRHFGPPPYFVASEDAFNQSLQNLAAAGVDINDLVSRIKAGRLSADDFANLVAETIVRDKG
jgi:tetratricopeptide (TPR) repeat protein